MNAAERHAKRFAQRRGERYAERHIRHGERNAHRRDGYRHASTTTATTTTTTLAKDEVGRSPPTAGETYRGFSMASKGATTAPTRTTEGVRL